MSKSNPLIAIVDDDESVCRAMSRLVRSLGMEVNAFVSGREFIDRIETTPSFQPDCVVLDVQMPGMNGLEVQERLASRGNPLPVIFITDPLALEFALRRRFAHFGCLQQRYLS